jgi:hypothetical protein
VLIDPQPISVKYQLVPIQAVTLDVKSDVVFSVDERGTVRKWSVDSKDARLVGLTRVPEMSSKVHLFMDYEAVSTYTPSSVPDSSRSTHDVDGKFSMQPDPSPILMLADQASVTSWDTQVRFTPTSTDEERFPNASKRVLSAKNKGRNRRATMQRPFVLQRRKGSMIAMHPGSGKRTTM